MNNQTITSYGSILVLELILKSEEYLNELIKTFPSIEDKVLSFSVDPGCSCRNDIIKFYDENKESVSKFTENFLSQHPNVIDYRAFIQKYETNVVSGQFFKVDKTESAYMEFVDRMQQEKWAFRYMSVAVEDDKYVIFFA